MDLAVGVLEEVDAGLVGQAAALVEQLAAKWVLGCLLAGLGGHRLRLRRGAAGQAGVGELTATSSTRGVTAIPANAGSFNSTPPPFISARMRAT